MQTVDAESPRIPDEAHAHVADLEGVTGRLRLDVGTTPFAVLEVRDGEVDLHRGDGAADAVVICDSEATIGSISQGTLNPVVAALQNRLELLGDRELGIKVILALRGHRLAGSENRSAES